MQILRQDIRYSARMLMKKPAFTAIAVLTLALGIGANTAIFTIVNAVLLRPLPYPEPERILQLGPDWAGSFQGVSPPKFIFWREHSQAFEAIAASQPTGAGVNLAGVDEPEFVPGLRVSVDFFRVLGVNPVMGRGFTEAEDSPGGERVAILSDGLWRRRFSADPAILGRTILLNSESFTVVGVMPPDFQFPTPADVIIPMRTNPASREMGHNLQVLARLKPGVTREQAQADLRLVFENFKAAHPQMLWNREEGIRAQPLLDSITASARPLLFILLGAVGFVLLIACANVANLQLTRAAARQKEMAVRIALGANLWRIARQLLTEGVLLALAGGLAGLLLAVWGVDALTTLIPQGLIPRAGDISFDWRVLAFTMTISVLTGLAFALAPAFQAARVDVNSSLKEGGGKGVAGAGRAKLRSALVVAEVALSLVLLIGAALLIRSFMELRRVDPGFDPHNILTFQVAPTGERYDTTVEMAEYFQRALERIRSLPGVEAAAVTSNLPLDRWLNLTVEIEGRPNSEQSTEIRLVTAEYFRVMRMNLRQGRTFTEADNAGSEPVAIVNDAYVRRNFKDTDPLGNRLIIQRRGADAKSCQIVGVVNDLKQFGLDSPAPPTVFVPLAQTPDPVMRTAMSFVTMKFVVRTANDPLSLSAAAKAEVLKADPQLPVTSLRSMEQILERSLAQGRFNMMLLGIFAAIGLALASIGIYGVMSYAVSQRTNEIGIRMALGAQAGDVLRLILRHGMILAMAGVVIGLAGAYGLTRLMQSLLFGVSATDPATFILISLVLIAAALLACYVPARRATKVDPMVALRHE
ncbi:MAG TPA: ABC transporter permease [Blastocatellia bacterium]|nr:ABC transporter permease [Blastocatellia bacterium]